MYRLLNWCQCLPGLQFWHTSEYTLKGKGGWEVGGARKGSIKCNNCKQINRRRELLGHVQTDPACQDFPSVVSYGVAAGYLLVFVSFYKICNRYPAIEALMFYSTTKRDSTNYN